jgi:hypothetical protein
MDYSHSPYLIYAIGSLGALLGVFFLVGAFLFMRRPKGPGGPGGPENGPGAGGPPPA